MIRYAACLSMLLCTVQATVLAAGPDRSIRPQARVVPNVSAPQETETLSTSGAVRPLERPLAVVEELASSFSDDVQQAVAVAAAMRGPGRGDLSETQGEDGVGLVAFSASSLRPIVRPPGIVQRAMARQREAQAGRAGGIRGVQGESVGAVPGRGACGIDNALRVRAVSGVRLSTPALLDVPTTRALKTWVDKGLKPAIGNMGGGVVEMRVVAHYACRTRNNQPGARLSEHSFGRAIDIAGFTLRNGERIVLLSDWGGGRKGRALRKMHRSACGTFGTVLGPEANRFHRDHFHFDTARHRGGSYCR